MGIKKWLVVVLLISFWGSLKAKEVTQTDAERVAINWLYNQGRQTLNHSDIDTVYTHPGEDGPLIYWVTFHSGGWVMVAANDEAEPVLGYSLNSVYAPENAPVQLRVWIEGLANEIENAAFDDVEVDPELAQKWQLVLDQNNRQAPLKSANTVQNVGPLLNCEWDQGEFYNELAPFDVNSSAGNDHVWIGCVATAMAQIMKYWEYPSTGVGSNSYVHDDYGLQYADFGATSYNWSAMPNRLTAENFEVQRISYHAAVAVNMNFDPVGSGAYLSDALDAFEENFKYNSTIFEPEKDKWNSDDWIQLLQNELDNGRPVLYAGYNASRSYGHAFVCDGYSDEFFHFNWGWGGYANGNYLLSALTPGSSNFSYEQSALIGIQPCTASPIGSPYIEGFEANNSGYLSLTGVAQIVSDSVHTGNYAVRLSKDTHSVKSKNVASLTFVVPEDGELNFWVKRHTPEGTGSNIQQALIMSEFGTNELIQIFSGGFDDSDWVNYSVDLTAYEGTTVRFMVIQHNNDVIREQWMYLDDVVITGNNINLAPYVPSLPSPTNEQEKVALSPLLKWSGGDPNGDAVSYNVYFGTDSNPELLSTVSDNQIRLNDLGHSQTYFWRIEASDGEYESAGDLWTFTTRDIPPEMGVCGITEISSTSAVVCGKVLDDNGLVIESKGIAWSTSGYPDLNDNYKTRGGTNYTYSCDLTNLLPYTTYYVRAFSNSSEGYAYSEQDTFKTLPDLAELAYIGLMDVKRTTARIEGEIIRINDEMLSSAGVVVSSVQGFSPEAGRWFYTDQDGLAEGSFEVELSGLSGPDTLFIRVFAENTAGVAFSNEFVVVTINSPPVIDLDANNSSLAQHGNFKGLVSEQLFDGHVADDDAWIFDEDGDSVVYMRCILEQQFIDEEEYLFLENNAFVIEGNFTDTLTITSEVKRHNREWEALMKQVCLFVDNDAPDTEFKHTVQVFVSDGFANSETVAAEMTVVPVNDSPENSVLPEINGSLKVGELLTVQEGKWSDVRDLENCLFSFSYRWEIGWEDSVFESLNSDSLLVLDNWCGLNIRLVEEVTDPGCGGQNAVTSSVTTDFIPIEKETQSISFEPIPDQKYSLNPYRLEGISSSGLPINYSTHSSGLISISNDTVFMHKTGRAVITASQEGNDCFYPAEDVFRMMTIAPGDQEILYNHPGELFMADAFVMNFAHSSAGLPLSIESSDTSVIQVHNDTLMFKGSGNVTITFYQWGNDYMTPAEPVAVQLNLSKSEQFLAVEHQKFDYLFGDESFGLNLSNSSGLDPEVRLSDTTVMQYKDKQFSILGPGNCMVEIWHPGNEAYFASNVLQLDFEVSKGNQTLLLDDIYEFQFGNEPVSIHLSSSSGLSDFDLEFIENNLGVFVNDSLYLENAGTSLLKVVQEGDDFWQAVEDTVQVVVHKGDQFVVFETLPDADYKGDALKLEFSNDSGLDVLFEIGDTSVAFIDEGLLYPKEAGQTTVTAFHPGNENWNPSNSVECLFDVNQIEQVITTNLPHELYTNMELSLADFLVSSNLEIDLFESSNPEVLLVEDNQFALLDSGQVILSVIQNGNRNYIAKTEHFEFSVAYPVGILQKSNDLFIYPNPVDDLLFVRLGAEVKLPVEVSVYNALGKLVLTDVLYFTNKKIDLTGLERGVYTFVVPLRDACLTRKLIVK